MTLPFRAWRGHRDAARARAFGRRPRRAAPRPLRARREIAGAGGRRRASARIARIAAAQAALARGDVAAARAHLDALGERHAASRAIAIAELALAAGPPDRCAGRTRCARRAAAAAARPGAARRGAGRVRAEPAQAYGLLGALRQQQALPAARLSRTRSALGRSLAARSRRRQRARRALGNAAETAEERTDRRRRLCRTRRRVALGRRRGEEHRTGARRALGRNPRRALRHAADRPPRRAPRQCRALAAGASREPGAAVDAGALVARAGPVAAGRGLPAPRPRAGRRQRGLGGTRPRLRAGRRRAARAPGYANALRAARGEAVAGIRRPRPAAEDLRPGRGRGARRTRRCRGCAE